LLNQELSGS